MTRPLRSSRSTYSAGGPLPGLLLLLICTSAVFAQLPTATVLGVVKDSSGAVVPGATLTARNVETGESRNTIASENGAYRFAALLVGKYEIHVEHPGFRAEVRSGLELAVGQEAVANFTLEVGAIEQTVAVTAEAPLVNTTSGSLGGLVEERRIAEMPLNGRNFADLILLQTGVVEAKNQAGGTGKWLSSNGAPVRSNNFLLDGAIMQNFIGANSASVSGSTLGLDGIQEFRVVTNFFSAEYGMTMGSQMTMVSKRGTNSFHGTAFEYMRNSALDARNFFDRRTETNMRRLPAFTRNNFGGSFGGPIRRDKLFFFGTFEGVEERLGRSLIMDTIPAAYKADGGLVPKIDPRIKPLLVLYPNPNLPNNQFLFPSSQKTNERYGQMRVDHSFSSNNTMFGRYTITDAAERQPLSSPEFQLISGSRNQYLTVSENHVFSPVLLNTMRFSYSRTLSQTTSPTKYSGPGFSFAPGQVIGAITVGGLTSIGPDSGSPSHPQQGIFTWSDDIFYTMGRHSLKFGTLINRYYFNPYSSSQAHGNLAFTDLQSFLLGQPQEYDALGPGALLGRRYRWMTLGFYGQDDLRISPTFTLNLGLRYEFDTVPRDADGKEANVRDIQHDAQATFGPIMRNPSLKNVSPRLGFAWDVRGNGRTALRGGFALLYDILTIGPVLNAGATKMPPYSLVAQVQGPEAAATFSIPFNFPASAIAAAKYTLIDYNYHQPHILSYNLTVERQLPGDMALTLAYVGSRGINIGGHNEGNPTVPQILSDGRPFWTGKESRTNPNFGSISYIEAGSNSWYSSLQFVLLKRLSKGLQFQSSYTWSKMIDQGQLQLKDDSTAEATFSPDPAHRGQVDRGLSAWDIPQRWQFNLLYHLPELASGKATGVLLKGWWVGNILTLQSGYPFTPLLVNNRSRSKVRTGTNIDRPDLLLGRKNSNIVVGGPDHYFDASAFTIPVIGFLGNAGRNILRGPGFANLDFSAGKDTGLRFLGESVKLEFRTEAFNILNRANFGMPANAVYAAAQNLESPLSNVGRITATSGSSRQIQFALKLLF